MKPKVHEHQKNNFKLVSKTLLIFLFLSLGMVCRAQYSEFTVYGNGLIYSDESVSKLKHIVDSLNLKFKVCDANKTYNAMKQAKAHFIMIEGKQAQAAMKMMKADASFESVVAQFPKAEIDRNLVTVKVAYKNYEDKDVIEIFTPELNRKQGPTLYFESNAERKSVSGPLKGKWRYDYSPKSEYSSESIDAYFFVEEFQTKPIPKKYARWIQYSDCLVDTTAQVFTDRAINTGVRYYSEEPNKAREFTEFVYSIVKRPNFYSEEIVEEAAPSEQLSRKEMRKLKRKMKSGKKALENIIATDTVAVADAILDSLAIADTAMIGYKLEPRYEAFSKRVEQYEKTRMQRVDSLKNKTPDFMTRLRDAYDDVLVSGQSSDDFEELVGRYISKDAALTLKRNRRVVGGCSMDQSPRYHALNIALLSAETTKWEVFLRSHLDIMNDRFDRVSDGSYAQGARQTYIKELETLDINVPDLLMGISIRIDNPAQNHYFSSIGRTGRALAESKDVKVFEDLMLDMIADNDLDDYNRIVMYYLFDNYNYHLDDKQAQSGNWQRLKTAVAKMPDYISSRIAIDK